MTEKDTPVPVEAIPSVQGGLSGLASANAPASTLVTAALAWRLEPPADDEATALVSRELIPLYLHYVDDHIARLRAIDHHRLADGFERWRSRLLA